MIQYGQIVYKVPDDFQEIRGPSDEEDSFESNGKDQSRPGCGREERGWVS